MFFALLIGFIPNNSANPCGKDISMSFALLIGIIGIILFLIGFFGGKAVQRYRPILIVFGLALVVYGIRAATC